MLDFANINRKERHQRLECDDRLAGVAYPTTCGRLDSLTSLGHAPLDSLRVNEGVAS